MRGTAHLHICMQAAQCSLAHLSTGFLIWACVLQLWSHGLVCRPALSWLPVQAPRQRMRRRLAGTSAPMRYCLFRRCATTKCMACFGGCAGGLATLVEKKSRRMELAIYCLSRALESFALCLVHWGLVRRRALSPLRALILTQCNPC